MSTLDILLFLLLIPTRVVLRSKEKLETVNVILSSKDLIDLNKKPKDLIALKL